MAKAVRAAWDQPMALIEQDYHRRILLSNEGISPDLNIELIKRTVLFAFEHSLDVIMEGIFRAKHHEKMFAELVQQHPANNHFFYFDVSFEETIRRHQHRAEKNEFGEKEMRTWYKKQNFLSCTQEIQIPESNSLQQTIKFITAACKRKAPFTYS